MAAGLPTIASRVGGNAELIEDGVTGLLVPSEDAVALSSALLRLLRDPELARHLAENGQRMAVENYSFERLIRVKSKDSTPNCSIVTKEEPDRWRINPSGCAAWPGSVR